MSKLDSLNGKRREIAKARRTGEGGSRLFFTSASFASSSRVRALAACSLVCLATACKDIGRGGTGELVVSTTDLREIQTIDPAEHATTAPTTAPSTQPTSRATTQPMADVSLSIADVRQRALANNLDLQVELITPSIARESLNEQEAFYEAVFTTNLAYGTNDAPVANTVTEELEGTQGQNWRLTPGLRIPLRTGGVFDFAVPMNRSESNSSSATLNPAYTSDASFRLSQPLLRGGGIDVNAQSIRVAFYGYQRAQARTKLQIITVLANADRVYWRLYAARQALEVRRQEYDLAVAQLERARRQFRAGAAAEVEIVRAQAGVSDRVEAIINADNLVRDRERDLKRILNDAAIGMESPTILIPATLPTPLYFRVDPDRLVQRSMHQRMELLESALSIAQAQSDERVARHEMLPLLSLDYTYNINGLGEDWGDSFTQVKDGDFQDHAVGLRLEIPIGNEAARSRLRQAILRRMQDLATRAQREAQIRQEVLNAVDQLEANWQRILAARQRVILNQRLLDVEIRQFDQGLRTSTEVLNAQTNLSNARLSEISALSDYQIAQVDIAFATGTLLGASQVVWEPVPAPNP